MILGLFEVYWVMPKFVVELLVCWKSRFGHHQNGHIWMVIPHCLMWCICGERNSRIFEDTVSSMPDFKLFFFRILLDWLLVVRNLSLFSIVDLLDLCNFCNRLFTPVYFLYTWVALFLIYIILLLIK